MNGRPPLRLVNVESSGYSARALAVLRQFAAVREEQTLDRANLLEAVGDAEALIVRLANQIDAEVLDAAPALKVIVSATTGLDHIDLDAARERGVTVLSLRGEFDFLRTIPASSEHTFALLLALKRRIPEACNRVRAGEWNRDALKGHDVSGATMGIVGMGRVGQKVAGYGHSFDMVVVGFDPGFDGPWPGKVRRYSSMEEMLPVSEVLSIHVPLNDETYHLIGRDELRLLPEGAVLINTARGAVVDEEALVENLESGHLAGAATDVLEHERDDAARSSSALLSYAASRDNLIVTPHIAGATYESMARTEEFMANKLKTWWCSGVEMGAQKATIL